MFCFKVVLCFSAGVMSLFLVGIFTVTLELSRKEEKEEEAWWCLDNQPEGPEVKNED